MFQGTIDVYYQQAVTTLRDGGGTFDRDAARAHKLPHRYVVAVGKPHALQVPEPSIKTLQRALQTLADDRAAWPAGTDRALGTWIETNDDGVLVAYVDVSESYADQDEALAVARARGELAIWDTVNQESIWV